MKYSKGVLFNAL